MKSVVVRRSTAHSDVGSNEERRRSSDDDRGASSFVSRRRKTRAQSARATRRRAKWSASLIVNDIREHGPTQPPKRPACKRKIAKRKVACMAASARKKRAAYTQPTGAPPQRQRTGAPGHTPARAPNKRTRTTHCARDKTAARRFFQRGKNAERQAPPREPTPLHAAKNKRGAHERAEASHHSARPRGDRARGD